MDEADALRAILTEAFATAGLLLSTSAPIDDGDGLSLDSEVVGDPSLDSGRQHGAAQPIRDGGGDGDEDVAEVPMSRREAAEAESAAFVGAIPGCDWLKGVEIGALLETPMREIAEAWEGGRLPAMGFTSDEVRRFVLAVFEDTARRDEALERIIAE